MSSNSKQILLFANGPLPAPEKVRFLINPDALLIAVDGGLKHLVALGQVPDLIIGDLDSADPRDVQRFKDQQVEVRQFPADKDETDLELAISAALEMKPTTIRIIAALGDRIDQTLGNIFLLTKPVLAEMDIRLVDDLREVFIIRKIGQLQGEMGQRVSLLPLKGVVEGVRTQGLKYKLENETLYPDRTRGISNTMEEESAIIEIKKGLLLCIHEFSNKSPERRG